MLTLYFIAAAFPLIIALLKGIFKRRLLAPFFVFLTISFLIECALIWTSTKGIYNTWLVNLWLLLQGGVLFYFFSRLFVSKSSYLFFLIGITSSLLLFLLKFRSLNYLNLPLQYFTHYTIGILAAAFLTKIMQQAKRTPTKLPLFWICSGLCTFFLGSTIIFILHNIFERQQQLWLGNIYNTITFSLIALSNTLYSIGLLCSSKNTTSRFS